MSLNKREYSLSKERFKACTTFIYLRLLSTSPNLLSNSLICATTLSICLSIVFFHVTGFTQWAKIIHVTCRHWLATIFTISHHHMMRLVCYFKDVTFNDNLYFAFLFSYIIRYKRTPNKWCPQLVSNCVHLKLHNSSNSNWIVWNCIYPLMCR